MAVNGERGRKRPRTILLLLGLTLILVLGGTLGYALLEDMAPLDALYMTVITVTTVGFQEVRPLSEAGRVFTIALILAGVSLGAAAVSHLSTRMLGYLPGWRRRRMEKIAENLSDQVVLCGYGRMGQIVRQELEAAGRSFVVIERDPDVVDRLTEERVPAISGDATDEETLERAGVDRASGVIAAVHSDADNVFITMSARQLNPDCPIVARAEDPRTASKLRRAGATAVVTPYQLGGKRLALAFLRPAAVDLADLALGDRGVHEVLIQELTLPPGLEANTLAGLALGQSFGLIAVAVRRAADGALAFNPRADTSLHAGDTLLVMGDRGQIDVFCRSVGVEAEEPAPA